MFVLVTLLGIIIPYFIHVVYQKKYFSYKRFSKPNMVKIDNEQEDFNKNRYTKSKIPNNIDTIVVGSGIGGLTTAALLSKSGKKVLVLEQHYIAGGTTHSFVDKGVEHETGLHYIGNINKRRSVLDMICFNPLYWCKMGWERKDEREVYDKIVIGEETYDFESGQEKLTKYLMERFPHIEKHCFDAYFYHIKKAAEKDSFFLAKVIPYRWISYLFYAFDYRYDYYCKTSAYDLVKQIFNDDQLIAVLFGQFGDYGVTPKKASFFIHASIVNHYLDGGWYPQGGSGVIGNEICKTIKQHGGEVLVGKAVKKILTKKNCVYGVEMENGDIIYSKTVVSGTGLRNTFQKLVDVPKESIYKKMLSKMPPSIQHIYCFVKLEGDPQDLNLSSSNYWIYPHNDYEKVMDDFLEDPLSAPIPLFMAFSCMKDRDWSKKYPNVSNAIILTVGKKEWFEEWENERCMKRGADYESFKTQIGERMLEEGLFKFYPELRDKVVETNMATPLTSQFYLNSVDGESYGLDMNTYRLTEAIDLKPKTNINGLYLTGQDICTLGVTGAMMAGVLTANVVAGYDNLLDIIIGNNILKDLSKN